MNKRRLAHIISVTEIDESKKPSYLHIAQPVTIKSMLVAQKAAAQTVDVELFAIKHKAEKVNLPEGFGWAKDIDLYAWEYIDGLREFHPHKPLPRLCDILEGLYNVSYAEFFIYTNVHMGLYPNFWL